jgi:hypothetical protein
LWDGRIEYMSEVFAKMGKGQGEGERVASPQLAPAK